MVKKVIANFVALNRNESYAETEKDLRKLLEWSKELGLIMYTRLDANPIIGKEIGSNSS